MQYSKYQLDIFDEVVNGTDNLVVEALAGSGKTSTLIESVRRLPTDKKIVVLSFSRKTVGELKQRINQNNIHIYTLHSFGKKFVHKAFKETQLDEYKADNILELILDDKIEKEVRYQLQKAISFCKNTLSHTKEEIDDVLDNYNIDTLDLDREEFVDLVLRSLEINKNDTSTHDKDDMIWFPNIHEKKVKLDTYDYIFLDEAQDSNNAQIQMCLKMFHKQSKRKNAKDKGKTKMIVFGDRWQSLYSWRGADTKSMENFVQYLNAKTLPLSITYRCPIYVVDEAKKFVPQLEPAPNAKYGQVDSIDLEKMKKEVKPGCFILSRTNAPLISLALYFLRNKVPCNIQGRDIGENLIGLINSSKKKNLEDFFKYLESWADKEKKRLLASKKDFGHIMEKVDCFHALAESSDSLDELKNTIRRLFDDQEDSRKIILSTVHRAKGLERDVVYLLSDTFRQHNQEEKNINYVAITRSKDKLYYVV